MTNNPMGRAPALPLTSWTLFNYGAVGLAIMTGYILTAYRGNRPLFAAFLILCINMCGNHALHTTPTALLAIIIIALMERERKEGTDNGC